MSPPVSKTEQRRIVMMYETILFNNRCFMISKTWWMRWDSYVNDKGPMPGAVYNLDLVTEPSQSIPFDWTNSNLKPGIRDDVDYILINKEIWECMQNWYGGGPEICIFLTTGNDIRCKEGQPDVNPIKLSVIFHKNSKRIEKSAILVSLEMTCKELHKYIERIFSIKCDTLEIKFNAYEQQKELIKDSTLLIENGIRENSVIHIAGIQDENSNKFSNDYVNCAYEGDLKKAIEASLEDNKTNKYDKILETFHGKELADEMIMEKFKKAEKLMGEKLKEEKILVKTKTPTEIQASIEEIEQYAMTLIKNHN